MNTKTFFAMLLSLLFLSACSNPDKINLAKLSLTDLDGNAASLSDYKGKPVFLSFWATWCRDCLVEKPSIMKAKAEMAESDLVFLFVSDEERERIDKYEARYQLGLNYLLLTKSLKQHGVFYIPQTYLIDRKGNIVHAAEGTTNWATDENLALIKGLVQ